MIATLPMKELTALDYRYALDASMSLLGGKNSFLVRCNLPELFEEVRQRLPNDWLKLGQATGALWIEPLRSSWSDELVELAACLSDDARLVIIASRPLSAIGRGGEGARGRPQVSSGTGGERPRQALGLRPGGIYQLRRGLHKEGFVLENEYGIHSPLAILLNSLSQQATRWGYRALGDRLHFAARLRYCTSSPASSLSTVALLVARKEGR
jgi:hypothetical protein